MKIATEVGESRDEVLPGRGRDRQYHPPLEGSGIAGAPLSSVDRGVCRSHSCTRTPVHPHRAGGAGRPLGSTFLPRGVLELRAFYYISDHSARDAPAWGGACSILLVSAKRVLNLHKLCRTRALTW